MEALVHWRTATLMKRASGDLLRPVSPPPPEGEFTGEPAQKMHERSKSDGSPLLAEKKGTQPSSGADSQGQSMTKKPTSSSWAAWWSRSRRTENESSQKYSAYDTVCRFSFVQRRVLTTLYSEVTGQVDSILTFAAGQQDFS